MFSDPLIAPLDVAGAETAYSFDRLPMDGGNTVYLNDTHSVGNPALVRISHSNVGKGSTARKRHLVSLEAYQKSDASTEDKTLPRVKFQLIMDVPDSAYEFGEDRLPLIADQFTGLLRFNGENHATLAMEFDGFLEKVLNGQS